MRWNEGLKVKIEEKRSFYHEGCQRAVYLCRRVCVMVRVMESECNVGDDGGVDVSLFRVHVGIGGQYECSRLRF